MNTHVERALIESLETDLRAKQEQVLNLIRERDEARQRLAAAEAAARWVLSFSDSDQLVQGAMNAGRGWQTQKRG